VLLTVRVQLYQIWTNSIQLCDHNYTVIIILCSSSCWMLWIGKCVLQILTPMYCLHYFRSLVGCSFCQVIGTNVSYCFTHLGPGFNPCVSTNGTSRTNNGVSCNSNWISSRSCEQYTTCTDCLAAWPNNHYENSNVWLCNKL